MKHQEDSSFKKALEVSTSKGNLRMTDALIKALEEAQRDSKEEGIRKVA